MNRVFALVAIVLGGFFGASPGPLFAATYKVRQTVTLGPIPAESKRIQWWVSIPGDDPLQRVLDLTVVSTPGEWSITSEPDHGGHFLYVEAKSPGKTSLDVVVEFTLERAPIQIAIDPARVGSIQTSERALFADELRRDAPHMAVTEQIQEMADTVCGSETNIAKEAKLLLAEVAKVADHYSKDPSKPKCGLGDAEACLTQGGGCCTDLHSLFIAMARGRGVPARLQMGYRMLPKNVGKEVDPGYRCWVEYFVPGYGWVPADIVEADATDGLGPDVWFSGLTEHRLWLNQGRELALSGGGTTVRVNHMSHGHALIDGVPARIIPEGDLPAQMNRKVIFQVLTPDASSAL